MSAPIFSATHRQMSVLSFIAGYQARNSGISPSIREIGRGVGVCCSGIHAILLRLQERGFITRKSGQDSFRQQVEILRAPPLPRAANGDPLHFISIECLSHRRRNTASGSAASSGNGRNISHGAIT